MPSDNDLKEVQRAFQHVVGYSEGLSNRLKVAYEKYAKLDYKFQVLQNANDENVIHIAAMMEKYGEGDLKRMEIDKKTVDRFRNKLCAINIDRKTDKEKIIIRYMTDAELEEYKQKNNMKEEPEQEAAQEELPAGEEETKDADL